MNKPLISVIIPIYNVEKYLQRCLDSVIHQTYSNLEVLLIDDGSTDGSGNIADKYVLDDNRLKVYHIPNGGVSEARNYGLAKCSGEYITFVDADDFILPNYIGRLYEVICECKVRHAVCIAYDSKDGTVDTRWELSIPVKINIREAFDYTKQYAGGTVWGSLYHRSLLENKFFKKDYYVGEDEIFFAEVLLSNDAIAFIEEELYVYMIYEQSASKGTYDEKKMTNVLAWDYIQQLFKDYPIKFQSNLRARCCVTYLSELKKMKRDNYKDKELVWHVIKNARYTLKDYLCLSSHSFLEKFSAVLYCAMPNVYGYLHKLLRN